jgi:hypothetical protein
LLPNVIDGDSPKNFYHRLYARPDRLPPGVNELALPMEAGNRGIRINVCLYSRWTGITGKEMAWLQKELL